VIIDENGVARIERGEAILHEQEVSLLNTFAAKVTGVEKCRVQHYEGCHSCFLAAVSGVNVLSSAGAISFTLIAADNAGIAPLRLNAKLNYIMAVTQLP
jgi:hypothetical protein